MRALALSVVLALVALVSGPAAAAPSFGLFWSDTTGLGTTGGSIIDAAPGDVLTLDVIVNIDPTGFTGAEWDLLGTAGLTAAANTLVSGLGGPPECPAPPNLVGGLCVGSSLATFFFPLIFGVTDIGSSTTNYDIESQSPEFSPQTMTVGRGVFIVGACAAVETVEVGFGGAGGGGALTDGAFSGSFSSASAVVIVAPTDNRFNIDFGFQAGPPSSDYGAAALQPGRWNEVGLGMTRLTDTSGFDTFVTIDVSSMDDTGFAGGMPVGPDELLLFDNFFNDLAQTWQANVCGLNPMSYDVYLYAPSHRNVPSGDVTVNGAAVASIEGDPGGTLIAGTSYAVVSTVAAGGTIAISGSASAFSGLAGLQLVPAPEPNGLFGLLAGSALLAGFARARRTGGGGRCCSAFRLCTQREWRQSYLSVLSIPPLASVPVSSREGPY